MLLPSVLIAAALTTGVVADQTLVGLDAPPFSAEGCLFEPRLTDSESLRGEVILLKFWGTT